MDYRGYGKSTGKISEQGLFHDARAIYDIMKKEYDENKIIIYGRSIGTGIATMLASENSPGNLVLESPFYNLRDLARRYYPWVPAYLIRFPFQNDKYIENVKCRIHIIHGEQDEIIPVIACLKLKDKLKPGDELTIIPGGHHNDLDMFRQYQVFLDSILK